MALPLSLTIPLKLWLYMNGLCSDKRWISSSVTCLGRPNRFYSSIVFYLDAAMFLLALTPSLFRLTAMYWYVSRCTFPMPKTLYSYHRGGLRLLHKTCISNDFIYYFPTGNVWIYSIYQPNYSKNSTDLGSYCDKTLYLFAFWITTLVYILVGLLLLTGCCVLFCFFICGRADPDDDANNPWETLQRFMMACLSLGGAVVAAVGFCYTNHPETTSVVMHNDFEIPEEWF